MKDNMDGKLQQFVSWIILIHLQIPFIKSVNTEILIEYATPQLETAHEKRAKTRCA